MTNVRLTNQEQQVIVAVIRAALTSQSIRSIGVYGSRADLLKSGGDIDLLVEVDGDPGDRFIAIQKIRSDLCRNLGEQKFDIFMISADSARNSDRENQFYKLISSEIKILWSSGG